LKRIKCDNWWSYQKGIVLWDANEYSLSTNLLDLMKDTTVGWLPKAYGMNYFETFAPFEKIEHN